MIRCLVQREMMHEKGFIKNPFLKPLAATVIEAEANQLCWTTGHLPHGECASVPLLWRTVTASPVGIEPMTIFGGGRGAVAWTVPFYVTAALVKK